jgi:hypothetical protein
MDEDAWARIWRAGRRRLAGMQIKPVPDRRVKRRHEHGHSVMSAAAATGGQFKLIKRTHQSRRPAIVMGFVRELMCADGGGDRWTGDKPICRPGARSGRKRGRVSVCVV